ncbi:hypothetical protein EVAR_98332_1 [Eumeta japonica]|uniref:Uncharacterized protein n=1 Tax=Eumeta variegata TaxID=151549 RepID=A0A4C1XE22_EUMVA|nr:hypothetical protein EVAR_98332_1 [Eumeta japonica]
MNNAARVRRSAKPANSRIIQSRGVNPAGMRCRCAISIISDEAPAPRPGRAPRANCCARTRVCADSVTLCCRFERFLRRQLFSTITSTTSSHVIVKVLFAIADVPLRITMIKTSTNIYTDIIKTNRRAFWELSSYESLIEATAATRRPSASGQDIRPPSASAADRTPAGRPRAQRTGHPPAVRERTGHSPAVAFLRQLSRLRAKPKQAETGRAPEIRAGVSRIKRSQNRHDVRNGERQIHLGLEKLSPAGGGVGAAATTALSKY